MEITVLDIQILKALHKEVREVSNADFGTKSHSRNPLIFGLFVRIRMVEQVGSGIGRIKDQMKDAKLSEPHFKTDGMFTVILPRAVEKSSGKSSSGDNREEIIELVKNNPSITREQLANNIGITVKGVDYHLTKMQKEGILKRDGSRKTGVWILNPSTRR